MDPWWKMSMSGYTVMKKIINTHNFTCCWCTKHRPQKNKKSQDRGKFLRIFPALHWNVCESTETMEHALYGSYPILSSNGPLSKPLYTAAVTLWPSSAWCITKVGICPNPTLRLPLVLLVGLGEYYSSSREGGQGGVEGGISPHPGPLMVLLLLLYAVLL